MKLNKIVMEKFEIENSQKQNVEYLIILTI